MKLEQRIDLLTSLGEYMRAASPAWQAAKHKAHAANGWFTPEFIETAVRQVAGRFLQRDALTAWARRYDVPDERVSPRTVGVVMAGNIPLVGFHDLLSVFLAGHKQLIKLSSRDEVLTRHLVERLVASDAEVAGWIGFAERLNGCDAYIATGSNNSARYFDYYFGKYPHIIRRNRTSVAVLTGDETWEELEALADDVYQYFGLGCRNVTQLLVPENYDFLRLLEAFRKYNYLTDLTKYKHNYDYQLTLLILNKKYYMTNESILLTENDSPFSPISVLHYTYYRPGSAPSPLSGEQGEIQCVVGRGHLPFGSAQQPGLEDYADGVDTMEFLKGL
ncbi:MAG TPA: acyl-CoA reductase [Puia sp.]|nr:acyl-CoA reductase [Puia sp.]